MLCGIFLDDELGVGPFAGPLLAPTCVRFLVRLLAIVGCLNSNWESIQSSEPLKMFTIGHHHVPVIDCASVVFL